MSSSRAEPLTLQYSTYYFAQLEGYVLVPSLYIYISMAIQYCISILYRELVYSTVGISQYQYLVPPVVENNSDYITYVLYPQFFNVSLTVSKL